MQETTQGLTKVQPPRLVELFAKEVELESKRTAKYLERLPLDKFNWAPHQKSMNLGKLAGHITDIFYLLYTIVEKDAVDFATDKIPFVNPENPEVLIQNLKRNTKLFLDSFQKFDESKFQDSWKMSSGPHTIYELPRHEMIRLEISHILHHRGQLSLYLRMLDVPLPNVYGSTADER
ncbi:MAG: DinB family protein [Bacteroidia bacterium]|nr:DinB family protein [Bacteroidia bacterium]